MTGVDLPDMQWPVWEAAEGWLSETARAAGEVELWPSQGPGPRAEGSRALKVKTRGVLKRPSIASLTLHQRFISDFRIPLEL